MLYEFLHRFFPRLAARLRRNTLADLGFPSHEELARVGLTGPEFYDRYILTTMPSRFASPADHANAILSKFWRDFPELKPKAKAASNLGPRENPSAPENFRLPDPVRMPTPEPPPNRRGR